MRKVLLIEPFYSGSHKVLIDIIHDELNSIEDVEALRMTLPGKKWHWRARTSALYFVQNIPKTKNLKCLFTSCVLPLHELVGLRPDLEYNQIMTCLAADLILFNSNFNRESFLGNIKKFFKLQPNYRPIGLREKIGPKCQVLYFPIKFTYSPSLQPERNSEMNVLRIVWPHRWEFDKNPEMFFRVIYSLVDKGKTNFRLNVVGESFSGNPPIFEAARIKLEGFIDNFGYIPEKAQYYQILHESDIVISTANHEFFGVSMLEGAEYQCFPLAPNNLVYPEIFAFEKCLYKSEEDLIDKLESYLDDPTTFAADKAQFFGEFSMQRFDLENLRSDYLDAILQ
ncbi:Glycosyltransferase-like domain-containing protein 1-like [Orchesella cincta]|uniref:tRNA-queuosine alpha-mannosyltransferase n=1 Tax=Orchesella cincta TaxID=48709 RepID=A0A1D2MSU0_ORCCI|nr:Glycosyltransferase-like domain-containing protein 1-like [Orchesella cincta]